MKSQYIILPFPVRFTISFIFIQLFLNVSLQDLLKKLYALRSAANKKPSTVEGVKQTAERNLSTSTNGSAPSQHEDAPSTAPVHGSLKKVQLKSTQSSAQHAKNQFDPLFWLFHSVRLKFGKIVIVLPSGKLMLLFSLLFSTIYVLRRKTAGLKRQGLPSTFHKINYSLFC